MSFHRIEVGCLGMTEEAYCFARVMCVGAREGILTLVLVMLRRVHMLIARSAHCANACTDVEDELGEHWLFHVLVSERCLLITRTEFPKSFTRRDDFGRSYLAFKYSEDHVADSTVEHLRCWARPVDIDESFKGIVGWFWHK